MDPVGSINENSVDEEHESLQAVSSYSKETVLGRLFNPTRKSYRYSSLILISMLSFGPYFCHSMLAALQIQFQRDLKISTSQFSVFVSLSSWPNIVLCFFGGTLIDKVFGIRAGALLTVLVVFAGQLLFGIGAYIDFLPLMYVGRFLFGMGCETAVVAQKTYAAQWFPKNEQNLIYGLLSSVTLLGPSLSQLSLIHVYNRVSKFKSGYECLGTTILLTLIILFLSLLASVILIPLDKHRSKYCKVKSTTTGIQRSICSIFGEIVKFPAQLWVISFIWMFFFGSSVVFISFGKKFMVEKFESSVFEASTQTSLFYFALVIFSPIFGVFVNTVGYNLYWLVLAASLTVASHMFFAFAFVNPYVVISILGIAGSLLNASLFTILPETVNGHQLAAAFGLFQSLINLGSSVFNIASGFILASKGFFGLELFNYYLTVCSLACTLILFFLDRLNGGRLNLSKKVRDRLNPKEMK